MNVDLDVLEGARIELTADGLKVTRTAYVEGLSGPLADRLRCALQGPGIPQTVGEGHPTMAGVALESVGAEPAGPEAAMVTMVYTTRKAVAAAAGGFATIEVTAQTQLERTDRDKDGKLIVVPYTPPATLTNPNPPAGQALASVEKLVCRPVVRISSTQRSSVSAVLEEIGQYMETTSDGGGLLDLGEGSWLCSALIYVSTDGGQTFQVARQFIHDPGEWKARAFYVDPETGRTPADAVEGNGIKTVHVYRDGGFPLG